MNIASILCWILGILNLLGGIVLGIPAVSTGKSILFPVGIFVIGIGLCFSAYGLRKNKRSAAILAIVFSALSLISPPLIGLIIGVAIIILTVTNWKRLS